MYYEFTRLNTGHFVTGSIDMSNSTIGPTGTLLSYNRTWRSTGGTATAVAFDVVSDYIETDY